jgi:hypothetical protein
MNGVFTTLVIKPAGVPISDGEVRTDHSDKQLGEVKTQQGRKQKLVLKAKRRRKRLPEQRTKHAHPGPQTRTLPGLPWR